MPCVVCTILKETRALVSWLSLKTKVDGFPGLGLKTGSYDLMIWLKKITVTVSWFVPQNQVGGGLSVCATKLMGG
jgi:hypothetical protein